jgi:hypothetical protein
LHPTIDGDTIVVAEQLIRLHGIDAPELDQTFWWRRQQSVCGTMSLAALDALIAGGKVRCEVVERHGRQGLLAQWGRHRLEVGVGGAGVPAVFEGLCRGRGRGGQAWVVEGHLRQALGVARIITDAPPRTHALSAGRDATAAGQSVISNRLE